MPGPLRAGWLAGVGSLLDPAERQRAQDIAAQVAARLSQPSERLNAAARQIKQAVRLRPIPDWVAPGAAPHSLGSGHLSIVPLFEAMYSLEGSARWRQLAEGAVADALEHLETLPFGMPRPGLFGGGLAGCLIAADHLSVEGADRLGSRARSLMPLSIDSYPPSNRGMSVRHYDLFSGLAGAGFAAVVCSGLEHLREGIGAEFSRIVAVNDSSGPIGLGLPAEFDPVEFHLGRRAPLTIVLGLGHGLSGPLATAASLLRLGQDPLLTRTALDAADWLAARRTPSGGWPASVEVATRPASITSGSEWCVGDTGISLALAHVGRHLDRGDLIALAETSFLRSAEATDLDTAPLSLCHGLAGAVVVAAWFGGFAESGRQEGFRQFAASAARQLVARYDPDQAVGFRTLVGPCAIDDPSLLTGAAGIALTLLALSTPIDAWWTRLFTLDPV